MEEEVGVQKWSSVNVRKTKIWKKFKRKQEALIKPLLEVRVFVRACASVRQNKGKKPCHDNISVA